MSIGRNLAIVVGLSLMVAGCGGRSAQSTHLPSSQVTGAAVKTVLQNQVSVPAGYGPIANLVGDTTSDGAWFWDSSATQDTIFHAAAGKLSSWVVLADDDFAAPQARGALALVQDGTVWLAVNETLVELNPATGVSHSWAIPLGADNSVQQIPDRLSGDLQPAAQAIAVSDDGLVAIASTQQSSVEVFNTASATFSRVVMPNDSDQPIAMAYGNDGSLCVGFSELGAGGLADSVLIMSRDGSSVVSKLQFPGAAWELTSDRSGFIAGMQSPETIGFDGTVALQPAPKDLTGSQVAPLSLQVLPGDTLLGTATTRVVEFDAATGIPTRTLDEPSTQCVRDGSGGGPDASPSPTPFLPASCPMQLRIVAADAEGNVWVVNPDGSESVAELIG